LRTLIAPLSDEVGQQLAALDPWRRELARRYIRRFALDPYLGYPLGHGRLATERCRAVRFDYDSNPDDLFGSRPTARRRGNQDLSAGPRWRIVYWMRETSDRQIRLIVVLAVGIAHPKPGGRSVFGDAEDHLTAIRKERRWAPSR
jgi:hypothetical protein